MPTRILVWNVQKFSKPKIFNADTRRGKRCEKGTSISKSEAAFDRLDYITTHIDLDVAGVPAPPDIIFIVEPQSTVGTRGHLALGKGAVGLRDLLDEIRHCTGVGTWMMVPPILASTKESVGIFYNSATHAFTGPWQWPGGNGPAFDPVAALARRNYPAVYNNRMPDRLVPTNDPLTPNGGINERRLAPGCTLTHRAPVIGPARAYDPGTLRLPYWVTFIERNTTVNPATSGRQLTFLVYHSPASFAAHAFLGNATTLSQVMDGIRPNEVRVLLGDFNLNLMTKAPGMPLSTPYQDLVAANYTLGLSRPGPPPNPIRGYAGYFTTLMRPRKKAKYNEKPTVEQAFYPGYLYADRSVTDPERRFWSIDNVIVRYGGAPAGGPLANTTILNGVVGSPFDRFLPSPGTPPPGHYEFPIWMDGLTYSPPHAPLLQSSPWVPGDEKHFRTWANFGRIRSTSDHCAIVADL